MSIPKDFYTTRVTVEIEYSHQFDPQNAYNGIVECNLNWPAVQNIKVIKAETNFAVHQNPQEDFHPVEITRHPTMFDLNK